MRSTLRAARRRAMKAGWLDIRGMRRAGRHLTPRNGSSRRRKVTGLQGAAVLALAGLGAAASQAFAASPSGATGAYNSSQASCSYTTVGDDTFAFPPDVSTVVVTANGAQGAAGQSAQDISGIGGLGGGATATVAAG